MAVGLRCGKNNSKTLLPDHVVAVGLRCEKANTKTPRSFAGLDPAFSRDSGWRSNLFPIKEESTRVATSSPFSKRPNGKELSCGAFVTTHPSPAPDDAYRVCRPCSVFTHPRASGCIGTSGTGRRTDTARRASGDATASSQISWMLFP